MPAMDGSALFRIVRRGVLDITCYQQEEGGRKIPRIHTISCKHGCLSTYFYLVNSLLFPRNHSRTPSGYEKEDCGRLRTKRGKYLMTADSDPHIN